MMLIHANLVYTFYELYLILWEETKVCLFPYDE